MWRPWQLRYVAKNRCAPEGNFQYAMSAQDYEHRIAEASHSTAKTAIYLGTSEDPIDAKIVESAFDFVNSPLTLRLSKRFDSAIYAKAAIHLFKFLAGEYKSLRPQPQDEAWDSISRLPGDPVAWLRSHGAVR